MRTYAYIITHTHTQTNNYTQHTYTHSNTLTQTIELVTFPQCEPVFLEIEPKGSQRINRLRDYF